MMIATATLRYIEYDSNNILMDGFYLAFTFYLYIFSLLLGTAEYKYIHILKYIEVLITNVGKGLFLLFIGILLFDDSRSVDLTASVLLSFIGIYNVIVGCLQPTIELKEKRENLMKPKMNLEKPK